MTSASGQFIIDLLKRELDKAARKHLIAISEHQDCIASANIWNRYNDNNPYDISYFNKRRDAAFKHLNNLMNAYQLAIHTFSRQET